MVDKIEMSLDDIIKSNKKNKPGGTTGRGGQRRGTSGGAPAQRKGGRRNAGPAAPPRKASAAGRDGGGILKGRSRGGIQKAKLSRGDVNSAWKHDMYDGPKRGGILKSGDTSSKLLVSNLDYGVSDSDIQELFAEFGPLKKAAVHYDRSGRSLGTADVVFERRADALKAIKQYNGVPLDGRPMNIQLATSDVSVLTRSAGGSSITRSGRLGSSNTVPSPRRKQTGNAPARRGGAAGGQRRNTPKNKPAASGGGGGRGRGRGPAPTAEELDAELDAYVNDMKI